MLQYPLIISNNCMSWQCRHEGIMAETAAHLLCTSETPDRPIRGHG